MRVRISVLGLLPVGLATVFVATFLAACGGGGGGGGTTLPPLSDNDLITRSAQEASTLTSSATLYIRSGLRGIPQSAPSILGQQSRGRQGWECPIIEDAAFEDYFVLGSRMYVAKGVVTLNYGAGCSGPDGEYGRGRITVEIGNATIDLLSLSMESFRTMKLSFQNFSFSSNIRPFTGTMVVAIDSENERMAYSLDISTRYSSTCADRLVFIGFLETNSFLNWLLGDFFYTIKGGGSYYSPLTGDTIGFIAVYHNTGTNQCPYPISGDEAWNFRGNKVQITYNTSQQCGLATLTINDGSPIPINLNNLPEIPPCR